MRIAAVSPVSHVGGAEVLLVDVLAGLVECGHEALLLTCGGPGELSRMAESRGVVTRVAPAIRLRSPRSFVRAGGLLRHAAVEFAADHIHCNHPHGGLVGVAARVRGASMSVQIHDPPPRHDPTGIAMAGVRAHFIANSAHTANAYRRRLPRAQSLTTIRPGRDLNLFRAAAEVGNSDRVLRAAGITETSRPLIVMVGRLQAFKGVFRFIDASVELPTATFVHIGPDAPTEPGTRQRAQDIITSRGLSGRVGLAGSVSLPDLAATVARADLLLHLSEGEAFGLVLVEAMAVGTPPIAMAAPGPNEILRSGGGVVIANGNSDTVSDAVRPFLDDETQLAILGAEALHRSDAFASSQMIMAYATLFARAGDGVCRAWS